MNYGIFSVQKYQPPVNDALKNEPPNRMYRNKMSPSVAQVTKNQKQTKGYTMPQMTKRLWPGWTISPRLTRREMASDHETSKYS